MGVLHLEVGEGNYQKACLMRLGLGPHFLDCLHKPRFASHLQYQSAITESKKVSYVLEASVAVLYLHT